jgi:hypothetical protein
MKVIAYDMLHDASHIKSTKSTAYDATLAFRRR